MQRGRRPALQEQSSSGKVSVAGAHITGKAEIAGEMWCGGDAHAGLLSGQVAEAAVSVGQSSIWDSGEWWMLLAAQSMAIGTVMVSANCPFFCSHMTNLEPPACLPCTKILARLSFSRTS